MGYTASKLISIALAEVGYLEKKSNSQLDDKTANAGYNNYTKYARDLYKAGFYNGNKNGYAWCDVWHDHCHWVAAGKNTKVAEEVICQTGDLGAACGYSANYYKNKGRFYKSNPLPGDQIFFWDSGKTAVAHTGIVTKVDDTYVYTVEGNTSGTSGVVANGGGVFEKKYKLNYTRIYGYGRPKYDPEGTPSEPVPPAKYTQEQFIRDVQSVTGSVVDGDAGPETIGNTPTLNIDSSIDKHIVVYLVQKRLDSLGYSVGATDGIYGSQTKAAVEKYQSDNDCVADGEITAKMKTWRKLLGMER